MLKNIVVSDHLLVMSFQKLAVIYLSSYADDHGCWNADYQEP